MNQSTGELDHHKVVDLDSMSVEKWIFSKVVFDRGKEGRLKMDWQVDLW